MKKTKRLSFKDTSSGTSVQRYFPVLIFLSAIVLLNAKEVKDVVIPGIDGLPPASVNIPAKGLFPVSGSDVDDRLTIDAGSDDMLISQFNWFVAQQVSASGRSINGNSLNEDYAQPDDDESVGCGNQILSNKNLNHSNL